MPLPRFCFPVKWDGPLVEGDELICGPAHEAEPAPPEPVLPGPRPPSPERGGLGFTADGRCLACGGVVHEWPEESA